MSGNNNGSTYTNLTSDQIQRTTEFFSKLDKENIGTLSISQLKEVCRLHNETQPRFDETTRHTPQWVFELMYSKGLNTYSEITLTDFLLYGADFPELEVSKERYYEICQNSDGILTFNELAKFYELKPEQIIPKSLGELWLESLQQLEQLDDTTQLTLHELLSFENNYNTTRYWPVE